MDLTVVTFNQRPDLFDQQEQICGRAFPEFLYYSDTAAAFWEKMISFHDAFQFMLLEQDQVAAVINCLPMDLDMPVGTLPDHAFDWAFEKSIKDYEDGNKPNAAVGVQIVVSEAYQGKGVSGTAIEALKKACLQKGLAKIIIPVRPTLKSRYPLQSMEDYIRWKRDDGLPFDPWLRVHVKCKASIVKVCGNAVEIKGTVAQWEKWTKMVFPLSGEYVVDGALRPVSIDRERNMGRYVEPNVWVSYDL